MDYYNIKDILEVILSEIRLDYIVICPGDVCPRYPHDWRPHDEARNQLITFYTTARYRLTLIRGRDYVCYPIKLPGL